VVTAKRDQAAALKLLKRIMKNYGQPRSIVTDGLCSYSAALKEWARLIGTKGVAASITGRRILISRFDDESALCGGFEARTRCKNSAQFMLRSTTISIRSAISSPAEFTSTDALPHWPSGALSRLECRFVVGVSRHAQSSCRYSDKALRASASSYALQGGAVGESEGQGQRRRQSGDGCPGRTRKAYPHPRGIRT
jgi:hypothetical protein